MTQGAVEWHCSPSDYEFTVYKVVNGYIAGSGTVLVSWLPEHNANRLHELLGRAVRRCELAHAWRIKNGHPPVFPWRSEPRRARAMAFLPKHLRWNQDVVCLDPWEWD